MHPCILNIPVFHEVARIRVRIPSTFASAPKTFAFPHASGLPRLRMRWTIGRGGGWVPTWGAETTIWTGGFPPPLRGHRRPRHPLLPRIEGSGSIPSTTTRHRCHRRGRWRTTRRDDRWIANSKKRGARPPPSRRGSTVRRRSPSPRRIPRRKIGVIAQGRAATTVATTTTTTTT